MNQRQQMNNQKKNMRYQENDQDQELEGNDQEEIDKQMDLVSLDE